MQEEKRQTTNRPPWPRFSLIWVSTMYLLRACVSGGRGGRTLRADALTSPAARSLRAVSSGLRARGGRRTEHALLDALADLLHPALDARAVLRVRPRRARERRRQQLLHVRAQQLRVEAWTRRRRERVPRRRRAHPRGLRRGHGVARTATSLAATTTTTAHGVHLVRAAGRRAGLLPQRVRARGRRVVPDEPTVRPPATRATHHRRHLRRAGVRARARA
jgi:hypothetical protein